ncbi:MAG TPA: four helix bundle protein [bacterium]|nr:four helix bundle protein [bacterium]
MQDNILKIKIHNFIKLVYVNTSKFPKEEIYGLTSQIRRAAVSIMLNYVEGYARKRPKVMLNFYEILYGSARECKYIIYLSYELKYIDQQNYQNLMAWADEISAMLYSSIQTINKNC